MNKKINIDRDMIKLLYLKHKDYILPFSIILLCIIIFIYAIIPQVKSIIDLQDQEKEEARKLEVLQNNLNLLSGLNSNLLDNQLKVASKALPVNKDFIGVLTGIDVASKKANVSLGSYSFTVGSILSENSKNIKGIPTISLELNVQGKIDNLLDFIKELKNTLPLSEVKSVNLNNRNSRIEIDFYYKPLPKLQVKDEVSLAPLSPQVTKLLEDLSKMNNSQSLDSESITLPQNSSPGAIFSTGR